MAAAQRLAPRVSAQASAFPATTPAPFVGEGYVSEATNLPAGEAFVAVVLAEPMSGQEVREVRALIYGDHENRIQEWFTGTVHDSTLALRSQRGAVLDGEIGPDNVRGTITLADDTRASFTAPPATGIAGLYEGLIFPEGQLVGTSQRGASLEGQIGDEPVGARRYLATGTFTVDGEEPVAFEAPVHQVGLEPLPEPVAAGFIVLSDGRIRGGARRNGEDFSDPFFW